MFAATFTGGAGFSVFLQPMARDLDWPRALLAGGLSLGTLTGPSWRHFLALWRIGSVPAWCSHSAVSASRWRWQSCPRLPSRYRSLLAFGFARAIDMGALNVAVSTSVSNWFVRQRGRALGIAMAGNAVGVVFLVPVAQWIITTARLANSLAYPRGRHRASFGRVRGSLFAPQTGRHGTGTGR